MSIDFRGGGLGFIERYPEARWINIVERAFLLAGLFISMPLLMFYGFPEVAFAIFLAPTKYAALSEILNLPRILSPVLLLFVCISAVAILAVLRQRKVVFIPKRVLVAFLGLYSLIILSLTYSADSKYGTTKVLEFITASTLSFFFPFLLFRNIAIFERFLKTFIVMGFFLVIITSASHPYFFQYYFSEQLYSGFQTLLGSNYLLIQHITGAAILILLYYFLLKNQSTRRRLFLIFLLVLFAVTFSIARARARFFPYLLQ